jgi:hypothetical protein
MSTTTTDKNDSATELLADCGRWRFAQLGELYRWTHPSGAVVEVREVAADRRGPHGETITGYRAVARPAPDAPVADVIVSDDGYLPSRSETVEAARGWMERSDGQLASETETEAN